MKRFFDKVDKTDSCWNWIASTRVGYGAFKYKGKVVGAHRFSWELHFGNIPEGLMVCHKCDNPKCVNPSHLFLGTNSDNMKDAYDKGRLDIDKNRYQYPKGHKPVNSLLQSEEEIQRIKCAIENRTGSLKQLSKDLGISYNLVRNINCGKTYKE